MRAFIALLPPPEVTDELDSFLEPRRDALAPRGHWRWTRREHRHLTLAFLPSLDEWREEQLIRDGEDWADRHTPVQLRLSGAGAFPSPDRARVLWAGIGEGGPILADLSRTVRGVVSHSGVQVDGTRFVPHVTVGRAAGRPRAAGHLVQALDTLRSSSWLADEVCLLASHLGQGPGGTPRYEVRHRWQLGG